MKEMINKYEQLQFAMNKSGLIDHKVTFGGVTGGDKPASVAANPTQEDATSKFIRELRERQAMAQDTQSIYAPGVGGTSSIYQQQPPRGNSALTMDNSVTGSSGLVQEQAKS